MSRPLSAAVYSWLRTGDKRAARLSLGLDAWLTDERIGTAVALAADATATVRPEGVAHSTQIDAKHNYVVWYDKGGGMAPSSVFTGDQLRRHWSSFLDAAARGQRVAVLREGISPDAAVAAPEAGAVRVPSTDYAWRLSDGSTWWPSSKAASADAERLKQADTSLTKTIAGISRGLGYEREPTRQRAEIRSILREAKAWARNAPLSEATREKPFAKLEAMNDRIEAAATDARKGIIDPKLRDRVLKLVYSPAHRTPQEVDPEVARALVAWFDAPEDEEAEYLRDAIAAARAKYGPDADVWSDPRAVGMPLEGSWPVDLQNTHDYTIGKAYAAFLYDDWMKRIRARAKGKIPASVVAEGGGHPVGYAWAVTAALSGKGEVGTLNIWPIATVASLKQTRSAVEALGRDRRGYGAVQLDPTRTLAQEVEVTREIWNKDRVPKVAKSRVIVHAITGAAPKQNPTVRSSSHLTKRDYPGVFRDGGRGVPAVDDPWPDQPCPTDHPCPDTVEEVRLSDEIAALLKIRDEALEQRLTGG